MAGFGVTTEVWLSVHRYRCRNQECPRKVFCERVPGVAQVYARHTDRLDEVIGAVGYVAGGLPAARLLERLAIRISDDSVRRRVVRQTVTPPEQPVRHLGVDDWAWRKYHTYGTILVDLDRHRVVDLLADRNADSLALWLTQHPTVELITRDRSGLYADGASRGAPQASQVADRFHLVLNLSAAIERVFEGRSRDLMPPMEVGDQPESPPSLSVKPAIQPTRQQQRRQRRLDRYQQVAECYRKGYSKLAIARELAVSIKTVHRWLRADQFPERKPPARRKKKVAEFAEYLEERWNSGCHNASLLFQEIRDRGYRGSRQMVGSFVAAWRSTGSRPLTKKEPQRIAPKHAAILTACAPDKLVPDQQVLLDRLAVQCPDILSLHRIALSFREVLTEKNGSALMRWIQTTKGCRFGRTTRALRLRLAEGPGGRYSRC